MQVIDVIKVLVPGAVAFFVGIVMTPALAHFLYKHKMWKKKARTEGLAGGGTPLFNKLHHDRETNVPRMGGIVIWGSVLITVLVFHALGMLFPSDLSGKLDFLSRNQTWLPLFTLIAASLVGLVDDVLVIRGTGGYIAGGLPLKVRILTVLILGFVGAWWFYAKLGVMSLMVPFYGPIALGLFFIPLFMVVMLALFSGGVIDGIDGLSGGIMASIFAAYAGIAFYQHYIDVAAFCTVVVGGLLAFLWFNIPPARFYMSETGILGLTTTLTVVAFFTGSVVLLPIIAFPLFAASGSVIIQTLSKKFRHGKKVFLIAPIHHHFEAIGWPPYKVTMRFWIISIIFATLGMIIALIGLPH